jgi:hypothetical protein
MIKKYYEFITENFKDNLILDIEEQLYVLDDLDYEYYIERHMFVYDEYNTYSVGYKIEANKKIDYDAIKKTINFLDKHYYISTYESTIYVMEFHELTKNDVFHILSISEEEKNKLEEYSKYLFENMYNKKMNTYGHSSEINNNVYYVYLDEQEKYLFEILSDTNRTQFSEIWSDFLDGFSKGYRINQCITKAIFEEHLQKNIYEPKLV